MADRRFMLSEAEKPSYFVSGFNGNKHESGKKVGSLPILAAGQFHLPNIIVKQLPTARRPRVFVACVKSIDHLEPYHVKP